MNHLQIYQILKQRFLEDIQEIHSDHTGDPYVIVNPEALVNVCTYLRDDPETAFDLLICVSGVDDRQTLWVVYHLYSTLKNHRAVLKVKADKSDPWVPTVTSVWPGANWFEREVYDLFGINFRGHPDLRRILLPDDWEGWPLRKDYRFPDTYQDVPLT
jgi:NADH-quinone oxidoreductase subunit C